MSDVSGPLCFSPVSPISYTDASDDPELYQGMPIGLQVIGRRGEDEAVLKMTEMIAGLLKGSA